MTLCTAKFVKAQLEDAKLLGQLRKQVWNNTYKGIYPEHMLENFDYDFHYKKDIERLSSSQYINYLIEVDGQKVGYLIIRNKGNIVTMQSLYILPQYQKKGIGKEAIILVKKYCQAQQISCFVCSCHPDNNNAIEFYKKMGGVIVGYDENNEESWQNSVIIKFCVKFGA